MSKDVVVGSEVVWGQVMSVFCLLRKWQIRTTLIVGIGIAMVLMRSNARAQVLSVSRGDAETIIGNLIKKGADPIDIRATAIHDSALIHAIRTGSRVRQIRVLLDDYSPELSELSGLDNVNLHISSVSKRGRFGSDRLHESFIMVVGADSYRFWSGPLIWRTAAFGPETRILAGSGAARESFQALCRTFDSDFASAPVLHVSNGSLPHYVVFVIIGLFSFAALCYLVRLNYRRKQALR